MKFKIKNLSCGYGKKLVVKDFNAELKDGEILCLLGPNGVGKTTVFKTILGFLKPFGGEILADGRDFFALNDKERAKIVSYVPQAHTPPFAFKVLDVVLMGRSPYIGTFENPSAKDVKIAEQKLEMLGMSEFADKIYTDISGGERQMVLIARALAQEANAVMLDEPASNLDFGNQIKILKAVKELAANGHKIIMTSHFAEHAFYIDAKVALLKRDQNIIYGSASEAITDENLRLAYGADIRVVKNEIEGRSVYSCVPII